MLVFMLLEIGVLIDIERQYINAMMLFFFAGLGFLALLQFVGILLVAAGRYRVGGVVQIVASAVHTFDLIGLIGVAGGIKAYRYSERLAISRPGAPSARETSIEQVHASPNQPDKVRIRTCQDGLEPDVYWGARSVSVVGNREEPSGETRVNQNSPYLYLP